ncbi:MAG: photosystem II reaction center protein Ycf12 [Microcystaceae cyanobacterium]
MNLITNLNVDPLLALNLEPIFQLTFVSLIMLAGPVVVFILFVRQGDL